MYPAESKFWSFPQCDNYRKSWPSVLEHQTGSFSVYFFHGKLTTLLIALWKVFRKVKTPLATLQLKISSSLNTENREGREMAQFSINTRTKVCGLSVCMHGDMHQHPHTQRGWAEVGRREGRMERGRERLRS